MTSLLPPCQARLLPAYCTTWTSTHHTSLPLPAKHVPGRLHITGFTTRMSTAPRSYQRCKVLLVTTGFLCSSSDSLPYIHTMSKQPDFLASMWKAAWSAVPHSFFPDLNSMLGEATSGKVEIMKYCNPLTITCSYIALHHCMCPWLGCKPFVKLQKPQL